MKKTTLKRYVMTFAAAIGLTVALAGVASAAPTVETAAAIKKHVGTADWRLPIYHYDDYDNWKVMQYYDISRRYEIPSDGAKTVTSEKAGEVYYSHPNRIVLFYEDGEVTGEYTKIGQIEATDDFKKAVADNPVLRGWGNKIVQIKSVK